MKLTIEVRGKTPADMAEVLSSIQAQISHYTGEGAGSGCDATTDTTFKWELKRDTKIKHSSRRVTFGGGDAL
jgi:hypothetical protein